MANEATLLFEVNHPLPFTVADGAGIERGTLLKIADPKTVSAQSAANDLFGGIAAEEKIANDGVTELAVYRDGIFKMTLSGSCTVGDCLVSDTNPNTVKTCPNHTTLSGANVVGIALETGAEAETIQVELRPQTVKYS